MNRFTLASVVAICLCGTYAQGQSAGYHEITRSVVSSAIPGDNVLRFYRMAIPVTFTAFEEDFNENYDRVVAFWREVEDYMNQVYGPVGFCFNVLENENLVMANRNLIDENIYNAPSYGTELLNEAIPHSSYDIGLWVTHRDEFEENSGLSVENGAYMHSTKASGYAKTDKWVVAHEVGHLLGAHHTPGGEGSLMDNEGDFLSYPSIRRIRKACMQRNAAYYSDEKLSNLVGTDYGGNYVYGIKVENTAPEFTEGKMKDVYSIPEGSGLSVSIHAKDADKDKLEYMSIGCDVENADYLSEGHNAPHFASKPPQTDDRIVYKAEWSADLFYDDFFYPVYGTDVENLHPGDYSISFMVRDVPSETRWNCEELKVSPFYSNYAIWEATIRIVPGEGRFEASISPDKNEYNAGEEVVVNWVAGNSCFTNESRVRVCMSTDYGKTFNHVLADGIPVRNEAVSVKLPNINIGDLDIDFITASRTMRGGIIKVEEINGEAFCLTPHLPENGGGFNVTGGEEVGISSASGDSTVTIFIYDLQGRRRRSFKEPGVYISNKKVIIR